VNIAITTVLDDKYLPGFLITFNSILQTSKNLNYDLIILEWGDLSDSNKQLIKSLYNNTTFRMVDKQSYVNHEYDNTWRTWTYNCNYRFDIFTYIEYDRVIFFDSDFIFQIDIEEIVELNIDFGAAPASEGQVHQIYGKLGFEGGLLTVGRKFLNKKTKTDLLQIANSSPPFDRNIKTRKWVSDEPILNTYFLDKITWLDPKYNFNTDRITRAQFESPHNFQFVGHNKPWYGLDFSDRFDKFVLNSITKNNGAYLSPLLLKKLLNLYDKQVNDLIAKNIDITKYTGLILPRRD